MVDYCFQQNILFGASDNLLSDQESSCASTDLNSLLSLNFEEEDQLTEEMINASFSQNSNMSTCSTNSSQTIYSSPYSSPYSSLGRNSTEPALVNTFTNQQCLTNQIGQQCTNHHQSNQINQQQQSLINTAGNMVNSIQDSQFTMMSNSFQTNTAQPSNSANPLLSYQSNCLPSNDQTNDLVRIQNECAISMSPTCSNTSSVSNHTLPSFIDTYSSTKLSTAADMNASIIEDDEFKNTVQPSSLNTGLTGNQIVHVTRSNNLNNNNLNNNLDDNFDSDDLLYEFESPLGQNEFCDDQSYSNSSFASVNLSTTTTPPPQPNTTVSESVGLNNCQSNQLFNLSASNCSSSLLINTPVSTPLNGLLSNCSSPISSIQDTCKPIKFKQEPIMEYDCNNNLTVLNQQSQQNSLPMNNLIKQNQPTSSIYSPNVAMLNNNNNNNKTSPPVEWVNSMLYNDFNSFELDVYPKNELNTSDEMNCMNNQQSIMTNLQDQSNFQTNQQTNQQSFNNEINRITQQPHQLQLNTSGSNKCMTTLTNKRLNPSLLQVNQMNQLNQQNKNLYSQTNRFKFIKNQTVTPDSSIYKVKQINQFTQQLNNAKYSSNISKTSLVCLVCGDSANCCHYKVVTCEGCKGFFKRTVQKSAKYTCLGNKDCVVDKRRRNRCQYCRYQKCLAVGMIKEVVRTDNLKGRRGRLPSKAKFNPMNVANNCPSIEFIRPLLEKLIKNYPTLKKPKQTLYRNENDCLEYSNNSMEFNSNQFNNNDYLRNGQYNKFNHLNDKQQIINQFKQIALEFTNDFARQIPGFNELDEINRKILISNSSLEVFTLFFAYRHSPGSTIYEFDDNLRLTRTECEKIFGQWFKGVEELMGRLVNMQIDLLSFTYLLAIVILYSFNDSNNNCDKVDKIQNKLVNSLKEFTDKDMEAQKKPSFFPKLLNLLPDLKNLKSFVDDNQSNMLIQFY